MGVSCFDDLGVSHIELVFEENNLIINRESPTGQQCNQILPLNNPNGTYEIYIGAVNGDNGLLHMDFDNFELCTEQEEPTIEERVSLLESWKEIIEDWKNSVINALAIINSKTEDLTNKVDNHEERITILENSSITENLTPDYWKYLSANERKNIVCGYAEDNRLSNIDYLGWSCKLTYKSTWKREIVNCKCKKY
jgi:hypothetical protein